ncbi:vicilin-like seed storage protein At2g18540 [Telopea speciosissima]|uniref:vicilin-like seed storage protein At2g18540 n=1 Tax=Telopea speciosissima TaxID=54955 RepID=UPI001CC3E041|nr:vicilin-like seed storage protein At2g18540 [Telopea speciosissima]
MAKRRNLSSPFLFAILISWFAAAVAELEGSKDVSGAGAATLVTKDQRRTIVKTDSGVISVVEISDGNRRPYNLQFITLDPNSLFLPVLLHANMVFYVHTGSGSLSWIGDDGRYNVQVKQGDVYSIPAGAVFFVRSSLESTRERLRIYAIFSDTNDQNPYESYIGAYSTVTDLVLGLDDKILESAFQVPQEVIEEIANGTKPPIIHVKSRNGTEQSEAGDWGAGIIEALEGPDPQELNSKMKAFNLFTAKHDFEDCNGWSLEVKPKNLPVLKGSSNFGVFMVNLTKGSMMGPHWNPRATEIGIVTQGQGMIRVVCPSSTSCKANESKCKNMRLRVSEGDVFVVSRFHPMAQMSFNNDTFVFMGFSSSAAKNYPQFLAGRRSVLRTLEKDILAIAFNVDNMTTIDRLLASQAKSIILECTSCAEEEEEAMEQEIEKERQGEEERKKKEEEEAEARRREEERKRKEEEEAKRREEEEAEERKRKEEEAKEKEEEIEEAKRREEEEEDRRKEEEEEDRRREEDGKKRQQEQKEARRQEEEEDRRRAEKEEREQEQARRWQREEEAEARQREKERRREAARRREKQEEEEREEEEAGRPERRKRWSEEEEEAGRSDPRKRWREEEEARRQDEEWQRRRGGEEWDGEGEGEARRVLNRKGRI